jgi:hypothetical protein
MATLNIPSSQALLELQEGFQTRIDSLGQPFVHKKSGTSFLGILLPVHPVDPMLELGSDWREMATLEALRNTVPAINYADVIAQTNPIWGAVGTPPQWKVVRREDNPADFAIKYWLVKITSQDAQPS